MSNNSFLWLANWQSQGEVDCIALLRQYQPKNKFGRGGSRIFFRRGCTCLLLYFNTNKPHSFFLENTSCIRKPQVISGGGVRTPCTLPLDPPLFGLFIKLFIFAYFFPGEKCKQTEFSRSVMHETEACLVPILITRQTCASSFQACWPVIPVNLQRFCVISLGESFWI